jgi:hypothetical protein
MIEAQNESNRCLTGEAKGFGVGFMALTDDVNVTLLNECFELRPFNGLCKIHPSDITEPPKKQQPHQKEAEAEEEDDNKTINQNEVEQEKSKTIIKQLEYDDNDDIQVGKAKVTTKKSARIASARMNTEHHLEDDQLSLMNSDNNNDENQREGTFDTMPEMKYKLSDYGLDIDYSSLDDQLYKNKQQKIQKKIFDDFNRQTMNKSSINEQQQSRQTSSLDDNDDNESSLNDYDVIY